MFNQCTCSHNHCNFPLHLAHCSLYVVFVLFYTHTQRNRYNGSLSQILWQLLVYLKPILTGKVECITLAFKSFLCKWPELYIVWRPSPLPEIHNKKYVRSEVKMLESKLFTRKLMLSTSSRWANPNLSAFGWSKKKSRFEIERTI